MTNRTKATKQYFPVVLFIMLYKAVLTFEAVYEILKCGVTIQMKATEQYLHCVIVYCTVLLQGGFKF